MAGPISLSCNSPPRDQQNDRQHHGHNRPANDLGRKADPVLKQLAETVGSELLCYRPPSPQASGGQIEEETRGGEDGEWEWVFLNTQQLNVQDVSLPAWFDADLSPARTRNLS